MKTHAEDFEGKAICGQRSRRVPLKMSKVPAEVTCFSCLQWITALTEKLGYRPLARRFQRA